MPESTGPTDSHTNQTGQLLDARGNPLPERPTWWHRCKAISLWMKITFVSILAVVAACATLLSNIQTIRNYFTATPTAPKVPPIVVEITNSGKNAISILNRGDFLLWLPGPNGHHTMGKYEFHTPGHAPIESGTFTVKSGAKIRLLAHVLNQDLFGRVLRQGDCDIAFMIRKANGGLRITNNLPFTKEAIDKYCTTVDIGTD